MNDIPRQRATNAGMALPMVSGVEEPVARQMTAVQNLLNELDARVDALENPPATVEETPKGYDDVEVQRKLRDLEGQVLRLKEATVHLANLYPIHRLAKVASRGETYMVCNWWDPVNAVLSEADVEVCYAPGADENSYDDDQIITVVNMRSNIVGSSGAYITWCDNSGGGSGFTFYIADNYTELSAITPSPEHEPALGYTRHTGSQPSWYYVYDWYINEWVSFTHFMTVD